MSFRFHPEALAEYQAAANYYATRTPGLQFRYLDAVEHALAQIVDAPEMGVPIDGDVRRWLVHVFPYAILYTIETENILILAIMHCHRAPGYWRRRAAD